MATYRFAVEHVGHPCGVMDNNPTWLQVSRHTTLSAARKAASRHIAEMHQALGPNAWDDHYRVVPIQDTKITFCFMCMGTDVPQRTHCDRAVSITVAWPAAEPQPNAVEHKPADWDSHVQCGECYAKYVVYQQESIASKEIE